MLVINAYCPCLVVNILCVNMLRIHEFTVNRVPARHRPCTVCGETLLQSTASIRQWIGRGTVPKTSAPVCSCTDILIWLYYERIIVIMLASIIIFRWRGSIYKLVWLDLLCFLFIYYLLNIVYRTALNDEQKV